MIQVVEQPCSSIERQVREYLARATSPQGVCGEYDPRWLHILRQGLDHQPYMLLARRNGPASELVGYLPLALVQSRLFGRYLVSLPYLNRAGVLADQPDVAGRLIDQAVELAEQLDVHYLELRHEQALEHPQLPHRRQEKVRMVLNLPLDEQTLWNNLSAKVRNQIRKGDKMDLSIRWGGRDLLADFYRVFAVNMRDLGTPVYGRRFFAGILETLNDRAELAVVDHQGQAAAAALLIHDPGSTQVPSASSLRRYHHTNANMWMYHQLLRRAVARGSRQFDFGRSSEESSTYRFKKQWGAQPQPTVWQYHLRRGDMNAMRPDSPRYRRRIAAWRKLPVWLTKLIGPPIVRGIP